MTFSIKRILIVDDHYLVRKALESYLERYDDFIVVGQAANGVEALEVCESLQPDVVLMDLNMPVMDGVEATRAISEQYPETRVIILTTYFDIEKIQAALEAGAVGYVLKDPPISRLAAVIRGINGNNFVNHIKGISKPDQRRDS